MLKSAQTVAASRSACVETPAAPVLASTMIAPQPEKTSAKVPTNSAASIRRERLRHHGPPSGIDGDRCACVADDDEVIDLCRRSARSLQPTIRGAIAYTSADGRRQFVVLTNSGTPDDNVGTPEAQRVFQRPVVTAACG
jgi:hypothetical protein